MDAYYSLENGTTEEKNLFKWLNRAFEDILKNPFCGIRIPKKQIPKEYVKKFEINNLLKYNLPNVWRLVYSVGSDEKIIVVAIVLEWMTHKQYNKRFKYKV